MALIIENRRNADPPNANRLISWMLLASSVMLILFGALLLYKIEQSPVSGRISYSTSFYQSSDACMIDVTGITLTPMNQRDLSEDEDGRGACVSKLFRYHGGACNPLDVDKVCVDYKTKHQKESFIVITDARGKDIQFQQWVVVGGFFKITAPNGFANDIHNVTIYSSEQMSPDTMLQSMLMRASCDGNLESSTSMLESSVGSIQLMAAAISGRHMKAKARLNLSIHVEDATTQLKLTQLVIVSNMDPIGWHNATHEVAGKTLSLGQNAIGLDWNVTADKSSGSMLVTVKAQNDAGEICVLTRLVRVEDMALRVGTTGLTAEES